ncbi:MAG: hypothetical protein K940chlam7_01923 [Chlamydiae bacterium]|nr:hypothetical protein [Chlamydiota bacterium]
MVIFAFCRKKYGLNRIKSCSIVKNCQKFTKVKFNLPLEKLHCELLAKKLFSQKMEVL